MSKGLQYGQWGYKIYGVHDLAEKQNSRRICLPLVPWKKCLLILELFGEADFELCHLIYWSVYPPNPSINYRPFLRALFDAAPQCAQVPKLAERLTIYQIEHEIQQIIWQGSEAESLRVPRLVHWMAGGVNDLFIELGLNVTSPN